MSYSKWWSINTLTVCTVLITSNIYSRPVICLSIWICSSLDPPSPKTPYWNQTWSASDDRLLRHDHLKFFQDGGGCHLEFVRTGDSAIRSAVPVNPILGPNMNWIGRPVRRYGHLKFFHDGGGRHLRFVRTGNSAIRCAVPENQPLVPNMKCIGWSVAENFSKSEVRRRSLVAGRRSVVNI